MITHYKPFSLCFDLETTRAGEQVHAEPEPLSADGARRLRDIERAGKLRCRLVGAETDAWETWRFCRFDLGREDEAEAHLRASTFYRTLYEKTCRLQARARGEAGS
jgi:hypothetical protein